MPKNPVSAVLITLNEAQGIRRAIESVRFADEILVVDSGSTDGTLEVAREMGAKVVERKWPGYGQQKNFAQDHATHDWILSLDGDEEVSPELQAEIVSLLQSGPSAAVYEVPRKTFYLDRWILHGGWYPNFQRRLYHRKQARWTEPEIHEWVETKGRIEQLKSPIIHYSFENIEDQVKTNLRFSRLGYNELIKGSQQKSLLRLVFKPVGKFFETYILKKGFLDGMAGLIISVNAAHSMFLKYAYFFERDPKRAKEKNSQ